MFSPPKDEDEGEPMSRLHMEELGRIPSKRAAEVPVDEAAGCSYGDSYADPSSSRYHKVIESISSDQNILTKTKPAQLVLKPVEISSIIEIISDTVPKNIPKPEPEFSNEAGPSSAMLEKRFKEVQRERELLPVAMVKDRIVQEIIDRPTVIIMAETGTGKTTQIPQFLYHAGLTQEGKIVVTQPRRIAAQTLARRVAFEMNCNIGSIVGYSVRFENVVTSSTAIKFITDGLLLKEILDDYLLTKYSVIIIDEAHERTVHTDMLIAHIRTIQVSRATICPLKIIIMSATINPKPMMDYFPNSVAICLKGRRHDLTNLFLTEETDDYYFTTLVSVFQLNQRLHIDDGILVFLTGQEEIETMAQNIMTISKDENHIGPDIDVSVLYAMLSTQMQMEAFELPRPGRRKVVLATNIAETSLTIPGINCVIDCGKVKMKFYRPETGLETLAVVPISKAQCWQRSGRAAREGRGLSYKIFTEKEFDEMLDEHIPEIQRACLTSAILQLLVVRVDPKTVMFLDKPDEKSIDEAYDLLDDLGAISKRGNPPIVSELANMMARIPLDPRYTKILLSASDLKCLQEVIIIMAIISGDNIFNAKPSEREKAHELNLKYLSHTGDHLTLLNIFRAYNSSKNKKEWCEKNYFSHRALYFSMKVKEQLAQLTCKNGLRLSSCGSNTDKVRQALLSGLFMNVAELQSDLTYKTLVTNETVEIHPSSILRTQKAPFVVYTELVKTNKTYMQQVTVVQGEWLNIMAPAFVARHNIVITSKS